MNPARDRSAKHGASIDSADQPDTDPDFRSPSGGPDDQKAKGNPNPKGN